MHELLTDRLRLRRWTETDRAPFAALNADVEVMAFLSAPLDRVKSDALIDRFEADHQRLGFSPWAVEVIAGSAFVGFVGLMETNLGPLHPSSPQISWRLARSAWGRGYATEAARAVCRDAFQRLKLAEILSFTVPANRRSRDVMERIGMTHDPAEDFDHPRLAAGDPLRRHVLYRLFVPPPS